MSLTLAAADNATTPTGATFTVSGSSSGLVTVYAAKMDVSTAFTAWGAVGSRTGDGAVSVSLGAGFWFAYAEEGGAVSPVTSPFVVTDGLAAVQTRTRAAILATLQLLDLPWSQRIVERWSDRDSLNLPAKPCCSLSTEGLADRVENYSSGLDLYGRPTVILLRDNAEKGDTSKQADYELWRQRIERAFHNQRLIGVTEIRFCTVEPYKILEADRDRFQDVVSSLVVWAYTREPRGIGA